VIVTDQYDQILFPMKQNIGWVSESFMHDV
jgi:hypothetical protein